MGDPYVVRMPFVTIMSLYAIGRPARAGVRSMRRAAFSASSGRNVTIAFTFGFTASMRAMYAFTSSVAESLRARMSRASFLAGM
jgi:hypothetical protein